MPELKQSEFRVTHLFIANLELKTIIQILFQKKGGAGTKLFIKLVPLAKKRYGSKPILPLPIHEFEDIELQSKVPYEFFSWPLKIRLTHEKRKKKREKSQPLICNGNMERETG